MNQNDEREQSDDELLDVLGGNASQRGSEGTRGKESGKQLINGILLFVGCAAVGTILYVTNFFSLFDHDPVTVNVERSLEDEEKATPPGKQRLAALEAAREIERRAAAAKYRRTLLDQRLKAANEHLQKAKLALSPSMTKAVRRLTEPDSELQKRLAHDTVFSEFVRFSRNELPGQRKVLEIQEYGGDVAIEEHRMLVLRDAIEDPSKLDVAENELRLFDEWYDGVRPLVMYYEAVTQILATADGLAAEDVPTTSVADRVEELVAAEQAIGRAEAVKNALSEKRQALAAVMGQSADSPGWLSPMFLHPKPGSFDSTLLSKPDDPFWNADAEWLTDARMAGSWCRKPLELPLLMQMLYVSNDQGGIRRGSGDRPVPRPEAALMLVGDLLSRGAAIPGLENWKPGTDVSEGQLVAIRRLPGDVELVLKHYPQFALSAADAVKRWRAGNVYYLRSEDEYRKRIPFWSHYRFIKQAFEPSVYRSFGLAPDSLERLSKNPN